MSITIGLVGRAGSGKDTMAEILRTKLESRGKRVYVAGFADIIKELMSEMYLVPLDCFYDRVLKEEVHPRMYGKTPREVCQWFGTNIVRDEVDRDFWYNRMITQIDDRGSDVTIITDCRFINEAMQLKMDKNAYLFYIDADERLPPMAHDAHVSEKDVYNIRDTVADVIVIDNNHTVEKFTHAVNSIIFS